LGILRINGTKLQLGGVKMTWISDDELRGPISGLVAGLNILLEILIAKKVLSPEELADMLAAQIATLRQSDDLAMIDAATVLDQIRRPLVSEERSIQRKLLNEPPAGTS
jgi:hypothetical protein